MFTKQTLEKLRYNQVMLRKAQDDLSDSSDDELMDDQGIDAQEIQEDYYETLDNFQQERFVFLFDKDLEFSKRAELKIKPEEYMKMIKLNREALVNFLQELLKGKLKPKKASNDD
jgi:hypothetical protein